MLKNKTVGPMLATVTAVVSTNPARVTSTTYSFRMRNGDCHSLIDVSLSSSSFDTC